MNGQRCARFVPHCIIGLNMVKMAVGIQHIYHMQLFFLYIIQNHIRIIAGINDHRFFAVWITENITIGFNWSYDQCFNVHHVYTSPFDLQETPDRLLCLARRFEEAAYRNNSAQNIFAKNTWSKTAWRCPAGE